MHPAIFPRFLSACLAVTLAAGLASAAEPHMKPLANGTHHKFCDTNDDLFDADGLMICARYNRRWPDKVGYAVFGPGADRFGGLVDRAVATARSITGRDIAPSDAPDLVVYIAEQPQTQAQVQLQAAARHLKLSDGDLAHLAAQMNDKTFPGFFGGSWSRWEGKAYRRFALLQLPARAPPENASVEYAKNVRDGVLSYFSIETAVDEIHDGCDYLGGEKYKPPPLLPVPLAQGTDGLTCARGVTLLKSGEATFCSEPHHWPSQGTYAVIGPGANRAADAIAAAAAHAKRLTGRDLTPGNPADMVLVFLDKPPTEPDLRAILAQSNVRARASGTMETAMVDAMKPFMTGLFDAARRADPDKVEAAIKNKSVFDMRAQSCRTITLEAIVRTDEPDATIRKDVDDMFLEFWGIEAPRSAAAASAPTGSAPR